MIIHPKSLYTVRVFSRRSLQRTLDELRDYQRKHEYWQVQQEKLLSEQANQGIRLDQKSSYEQQKRRESSVNMGEGTLQA